MNTKFLATVLLATLSIGQLSGCAAALIGGATVGGLSFIDRRTTGAQTDDQMMELRVNATVNNYLNNQYPHTRQRGISTVSYNRTILLLGAVPQESDRQFAERAAKAQTAVKNVYNYISVEPDQTKITQAIANDSWITTKIRGAMVSGTGFPPNQVKVVTYAGTTYLMGMLSPSEQQAAAQQVSTTPGVQKVITLFETINP